MLCNKRRPIGLKSKVCRIIVRPTVLYGSEYWPIKKTRVQRLMIAEIMLIIWVCGYMRPDRIANK